MRDEGNADAQGSGDGGGARSGKDTGGKGTVGGGGGGGGGSSGGGGSRVISTSKKLGFAIIAFRDEAEATMVFEAMNGLQVRAGAVYDAAALAEGGAEHELAIVEGGSDFVLRLRRCEHSDVVEVAPEDQRGSGGQGRRPEQQGPGQSNGGGRAGEEGEEEKASAARGAGAAEPSTGSAGASGRGGGGGRGGLGGGPGVQEVGQNPPLVDQLYPMDQRQLEHLRACVLARSRKSGGGGSGVADAAGACASTSAAAPVSAAPVAPAALMNKPEAVRKTAAAIEAAGGRPERRYVGRPLPADLRARLEASLRSLRWPARGHRPSLDSERYLVLQTKVSSDCYDDLRGLCAEVRDFVEPGFYYSALAVTKNFRGSPHIDERDRSYQYALSVGEFRGGQLCVDDGAVTLPRPTFWCGASLALARLAMRGAPASWEKTKAGLTEEWLVSP